MRAVPSLPQNVKRLDLESIRDFCDRYLFRERPDPDLLRLVADAPCFVAWYESSVAQAVEQILATSGEIIWVEWSDAVADKADRNARNAFFFSLY